MSEFFNNKDYGDYFSQLENSIYRRPEGNSERIALRTVSAPKRVRKASARRRAIIRRNAFVAVCFLVVLGIIGAIVAITGSLEGPKEPAPETVSVAEKSEVVKKEEPKKSYSFKADTATAQIGGEYESGNIIFVNRNTEKIVAQKADDTRCYPASTTKIMTLLVAVENIKNFDDTFTMTYQITDPLYRADATVAGFSAGEVINMTDLLYGVILPSGGDACIALAEKISGSEKEFVKLMNKKAKELGLENTSFKNSTGLHAEGHYTTAYDLAIMLSAALDNELCREILSTYQYTTAKTPQHPDGILLSSTLFNHMYGTEPEGADIKGGKTGFTGEAGYCIAAFGESDSGNEYICVTLSGNGKWPTYYNQIDLFSEYAK